MKIYFHFSELVLANTYLIGNEETGEAIIVDPCKITYKIIDQIEKNKFTLKAVFITRNHNRYNENGLKTILKIYPSNVYAWDDVVDGIKTTALKSDGLMSVAGFEVNYYSIHGNALIFQINNIAFTGSAISAGMIAKTSSIYALKNIRAGLKNKLLNQKKEVLIMPAFGPPTSISIEQNFNMDVLKELYFKKESLF